MKELPQKWATPYVRQYFAGRLEPFMMMLSAKDRYRLSCRIYRITTSQANPELPLLLYPVLRKMRDVQRVYPDFMFLTEAEKHTEVGRKPIKMSRLQIRMKRFYCDGCGERFDEQKALIPVSTYKFCTPCAIEHGVDPTKARRWGSRRKRR